MCRGGWEESVTAEFLPTDPIAEEVTNGTITRGFIIAHSQDFHRSRRVCLMYTVMNGNFGWTVGKSGCDRNIRPGITGEHRFNTTVNGPCSGSECPPVLSIIAVISYMFKSFCL